MLQLFKEHGWLKAKSKQRIDSNHIVGAVRHLSGLERVDETLRYTLNTLAVVCLDWLKLRIKADWAEWIERYDCPFSDIGVVLPKLMVNWWSWRKR